MKIHGPAQPNPGSAGPYTPNPSYLSWNNIDDRDKEQAPTLVSFLPPMDGIVDVLDYQMDSMWWSLIVFFHWLGRLPLMLDELQLFFSPVLEP